jgi:hypothetical protein
MKPLKYIFFITSLSFGAISGNELPPDVQRLVSQRDAAVSKIDRVFVDQLDKLKVQYTKEGNLEAANATVTLIKKFRIVEDKEDNQSESLSDIFGKTFSWSADGKDAGNRLILLEGGKGTFAGKAITWEHIEKRNIRITQSDGVIEETMWSADYKSFTGRSGRRGQVLAGKLIE